MYFVYSCFLFLFQVEEYINHPRYPFIEPDFQLFRNNMKNREVNSMKKVHIFIVILVSVSMGIFLLKNKETSNVDDAEEVVAVNKQPKEAKKSYSLVSSEPWDENRNSENSNASNVDERVKTTQVEEANEAPNTRTKIKENVKKIVKKSGVQKKFTSMNSLLEQQLEMLMTDSMSDEERADFMRLFNQEFDGEKLLNEYSEKMAKELSPEELQQLAQVYDDPTVAQFNQLNEEMSNPDNMQGFQDEFIEFMKNENENPSSPERRKQVEELDRSMGTSEQTLGLTMKLFDSSTNGMPAESIKEINSAIRTQVQNGLIFTTRNFSASDLRDLNKALGNSSVKKANEIMHSIIEVPLSKLMKSAEKKSSKSSNS